MLVIGVEFEIFISADCLYNRLKNILCFNLKSTLAVDDQNDYQLANVSSGFGTRGKISGLIIAPVNTAA